MTFEAKKCDIRKVTNSSDYLGSKNPRLASGSFAYGDELSELVLLISGKR